MIMHSKPGIWQYTRLSPDGVGGVELHIRETSKALRAQGYSVYIGRNQREAAEQLGFGRGNEIILHTHGDCWLAPRFLLAIRRRKLKVHWVHVAHGTTVGRALACKEYFRPATLRGATRDLVPARFADAFIAVSDQALHEVRRYFGSRLPAQVIANAINPEIFKPLKEVTTAARLIFVGRASDPVKNTELLLRACEDALHDVPELELIAVPGLEANAPFLKNRGAKFGEELAREFANARALVLCSLYEGDPIVLREAQALGLPVIASRLPQVEQCLKGYENVWWVNPHYMSSIRSAIVGVLNPEQKLAPHPIVRTWAHAAQELEAFYRQTFKLSL